MKKLYTLLAATTLLITGANAATYTLGSGKWNDANVWGGNYVGTVIKAGDEVVISGHVTVTTPIVIEGTLRVEKGASMMGMKDMLVTKNGNFVNNGNTVMKRIINEGTIDNNLLMEAMMDIENKGTINNNNNMVAGNNMQNYGGNAAGKGGAYFVNNNITSSPAAKFGADVKVFYGNAIETQTAMQGATMNLDATINSNTVVLNVTNPAKVNVSVFAVEKSTDGKNFTLVDMVSKVNAEQGMSYTDTQVNNNLTYYRVKAINAQGEEMVLPVATVKVAGESIFSMAR